MVREGARFCNRVAKPDAARSGERAAIAAPGDGEVRSAQLEPELATHAAARLGKPTFEAGLAVAEGAYGSAVRRYLDASLDAFKNRTRSSQCIKSLAVDDTATLRKGLRILRTWL